MNFVSAKTLRAVETAAPAVAVALLVAFAGWWIWFRRDKKEHYDDGCNDEYPEKGARDDNSNKGKCCKKKYSNRCQDTADCPADYPFKGVMDSNKGRCCKGRHSKRCQGGSAPAPASGDCQWFQTRGADGKCSGCPPSQKWDGSNCVSSPAAVVTAYQNSYFGSSSRDFSVGDYPDLNSFGWNDKISSLKIPAGLKVTLYQKPNYGGEFLDLSSGEHRDLAEFSFPGGKYSGMNVCAGGNNFCWNDTASSMKVQKA